MLARTPPSWAVTLALALVYTSWGTTYLAIGEGVRYLPPGLFSGVRLAAAGLLLVGFLALTRQPLALQRREFLSVVIGGAFMFVGGNGLITLGQRSVPSSMASVLVAATPLWLALLETCWPWGERLTGLGWLGLLTGLAGVLVLLAPQLQETETPQQFDAVGLVIASSMCWAIGSFILRRQRITHAHLAAAAYQMLLGGLILAAIGLAAGEAATLTCDMFTPQAIVSFFWLLVVGSLVGFVAYNWLLAHVSSTLAGTYAYVNPAVAVLVGALIGGETITGWLIAGLVVILGGVALVRAGCRSAGAH
jgi:drug/metabolite transporter (DMT)-like permease